MEQLNQDQMNLRQKLVHFMRRMPSDGIVLILMQQLIKRRWYFNYNVSFSGAVVPDRLFYYVLAQPRQAKSTYAGYLADQQYVDSYDDTFYGTKIDAYFDDNNILEITYFSDKTRIETDTYNYDDATFTRGTYIGRGFNYSGGENTIVNYTSNINDNWTLSFLYGRNEANRTIQSSADTCPQSMKELSLVEHLLQKVVGLISQSAKVLMKRNWQVTAEVSFDEHVIKFGYEAENLIAVDETISLVEITTC